MLPLQRLQLLCCQYQAWAKQTLAELLRYDNCFLPLKSSFAIIASLHPMLIIHQMQKAPLYRLNFLNRIRSTRTSQRTFLARSIGADFGSNRAWLNFGMGGHRGYMIDWSIRELPMGVRSGRWSALRLEVSRTPRPDWELSDISQSMPFPKVTPFGLLMHSAACWSGLIHM